MNMGKWSGRGRKEVKAKNWSVETILTGLKCLLCAYLVTGLCLMLLAFLLYRLRLEEQVVSIGIILIYIVAAFLSGFLMGKKQSEKRFLWGFLMGFLYFVILMVVSLGADGKVDVLAGNVLTTLAICSGSGMLGGMLS